MNYKVLDKDMENSIGVNINISIDHITGGVQQTPLFTVGCIMLGNTDKFSDHAPQFGRGLLVKVLGVPGHGLVVSPVLVHHVCNERHLGAGKAETLFGWRVGLIG